MQKYDYLTDYVLKNVWCSPRLDYTFVIEPKRITHRYGEWNTVNTGWRIVSLPKKSTRFHVFQYGQIYPLLLNLPNSRNNWTLISQACNEQNMLVDIYTKDGIMLPRTKAWYQVTRDNNLIMAIEESDVIDAPYGDEPIYFRFYTNAYFRSPRSYPQSQAVTITGKRIDTVTEIVTYQNQVEALRLQHGAVFCFVNGIYVNSITPLTARIGDEVEYVYDSSIKKIVTFKLSELKEFESTLDNRRKFLLNYPRDPGDEPIVDYKDDIDVYLMKRDSPISNRYRGRYYSHNSSDWLRNLTHRDYSIPVQLINSYIQANPEWPNSNDIEIQLFIRHGGFDHKLIFEDSRIHELYKLSDEKIPRAMVGIDSTLEYWRAAHLEASFYTKAMGIKITEVDRELTEDLLGYNAISKVLGDTPNLLYPKMGPMVADVPYGLQYQCTGFEYDDDGKLLGYNHHTGTSQWPIRNDDAKFVELIANYSDRLLDEYYGSPEVAIDPLYEYRCYTCPIINGIPSNEWTDVTDSGNYHIDNDNRLIWLVNPNTTYTLVRSNRRNLVYSTSITPTSATTRFAIKQQSFREGVLLEHNMQIPMGELDIWLNGHSLIEGVDYKVEFPEVVIIGKKWLKVPQDGPQDITIRFTNFCDSDLNYNRAGDRGYVNHGVISHNDVFNILDDKVLRIIIGGKTYMRQDVEFAEDHGGGTDPHPLNGQPYFVRDIIVPTRGLTDQSAYELRDKSLVIDQKVSDYMSIHLPNPHYGNPNAVLERYPVVSPFINIILHDLRAGILNDPRIQGWYTDMEVREIVSDYERYLIFDPTQPENQLDPTYVVCVPHVFDYVVEVNLFIYRFLDRVVKLYCNNLIQLSHFLKLEEY
ncbi:MAG: hypothetical protein M0R77_00745 [Gammaproteobacteria bacterium]|nr:hypothetical protein [Acholeplasmataceae bacterium]MCK9529082.1 hypothetical protein [Gammaproteobacteria bacterium]